MHFLVTAGPTREPLDPVRYLSNRSSGKMGYAIAGAARRAGHAVTLVSGPVSLPAPEGVQVVSVTTGQEMLMAVQENLPGVDVAIFAAAVADYRPAVIAPEKIKKSPGNWTLELEPVTDILGSVREGGFQGYLVGFAAETSHLLENARGKLQRKGCNLVVANDVSQPGTGFDAPENEITLLFADGRVNSLPRAPKTELAEILVGVLLEDMIPSGS